jgi:hypothetical protein
MCRFEFVRVFQELCPFGSVLCLCRFKKLCKWRPRLYALDTMHRVVTEMLGDFAVEDCMDYAHRATGIANCLTKPDDLAIFVFFSHIQFSATVFLNTVFLIRTRDGEHKKEGMHRTGNEGQQVRVGDAVDIVKCERRRETKRLCVLCDDGGVRFKRNPCLSY